MCFFLYFFVFFCAFSYTLLSQRLQNTGFVLLLHPLLHILLQFVFLALWKSIDAEHVGGEGLDACALAVLPTGDEEDTLAVGHSPQIVEQGLFITDESAAQRPSTHGEACWVHHSVAFASQQLLGMGEVGQIGGPW